MPCSNCESNPRSGADPPYLLVQNLLLIGLGVFYREVLAETGGNQGGISEKCRSASWLDSCFSCRVRVEGERTSGDNRASVDRSADIECAGNGSRGVVLRASGFHAWAGLRVHLWGA